MNIDEQEKCHGYFACVGDARDRTGGRVWTLHDRFGGMHPEAGGEFTYDDQEKLRTLAGEIHLKKPRVLRGGFAHYRMGGDGWRWMRASSPGRRASADAIAPLVRAYRLNGEEWSGAIAL